jgi:DNA-binding transcriptional ArsR family regulator
VLELATVTGRDADLYLGGRGLLLVPSVFVGYQPYLAIDLTDETARPYLVYPVLKDLAEANQLWSAGTSNGLADLLGRTRSAVLDAVVDGRGTGEIARRLGVSAATVSEHVSILRTAGLLTTRRDGTTTLHTLTSAGKALLGMDTVET